jgi:hypothetical protein
MSIRIHKVIGYGIKNIKASGGKIKDDRFSDKCKDNIDDVLSDKADSFRSWLVKNKNKMLSIAKVLFPDTSTHLAGYLYNDLKYNKHKNLFVFNSETHNKASLLFMPIEQSDWYRWDNIIDWVEECHIKKDVGGGKIINLFEKTPSCGIYPYDNMLLIPGRDSKIVQNGQKCTCLLPGEYNRMVGRYDSNLSPDITDEEILEHLKKDWIPDIPISIKLFCVYAGVFKNTESIYDLRPMYMSYWR